MIEYINKDGGKDKEWPILSDCKSIQIVSTQFFTPGVLKIENKEYSGMQSINQTVSGNFTIYLNNEFFRNANMLGVYGCQDMTPPISLGPSWKTQLGNPLGNPLENPLNPLNPLKIPLNVEYSQPIAANSQPSAKISLTWKCI